MSDEVMINTKPSYLIPNLLLVITILLMAFYYTAMVKQSDGWVVRAVTELVPVPVASVNGSWVLYRDLAERDIDYLIRDKSIEQLAKEHGIQPAKQELKDFEEVTGLEGSYAYTLFLAQKLKEELIEDENLDNIVNEHLNQSNIIIFLQ